MIIRNHNTKISGSLTGCPIFCHQLKIIGKISRHPTAQTLSIGYINRNTI